MSRKAVAKEHWDLILKDLKTQCPKDVVAFGYYYPCVLNVVTSQYRSKENLFNNVLAVRYLYMHICCQEGTPKLPEWFKYTYKLEGNLEKLN